MIITGRIEDIETENVSTALEKKVVTVTTNDNQKSFIEFRGPIMMKLLSDCKIDDQVLISVKFEGKRAIKTGVRFNNIVAQSIQKV